MSNSETRWSVKMLADAESWDSEIARESALGQVVLSASLIDDLLRTLIEASLIPEAVKPDLFEGPSAPFGNFSSRTRVAFAFGLIDQNEANVIHLLRKIRNDFAHDFSASFGDKKIQSRLREMRNNFPNLIMEQSLDYLEQLRAHVVAIGVRLSARTAQAAAQNPAVLVDRPLEDLLKDLLMKQ